MGRMDLTFVHTTMQTTSLKWTVGGDDILKRYTVSRLVAPQRTARIWFTRHERVVVFDNRTKAEQLAKRLNRSSSHLL